MLFDVQSVYLCKSYMSSVGVNDKSVVIYEPMYGNGALSNPIKAAGYNVVEQDLYTGEGDAKVDYLTSTFSDYTLCLPQRL